jgi:hypothetical protein
MQAWISGDRVYITFFRFIADRRRRRSPGLELLQFTLGDFELSAAATQAYSESRKDPDSWLVKTTYTGKMNINFSRKFTVHWCEARWTRHTSTLLMHFPNNPALLDWELSNQQ